MRRSQRACGAGALAASRLGAQPSLPGAREVDAILGRMTPTPIILDCDPGHDDAIALLLAVASPELELVGVTTVSGNQTLDKTTANALRVLEFAGRADIPVYAGADKPFVRKRDVAAHVHGESGPRRPRPAAAVARGRAAARGRLPRRARSARRDGKVTLVPTGPLTNIGLLFSLHPDARPERIVLMGGSIGEGNRTPAAEFNIWADPEAAQRVFVEGLDTTMVGLDVTHRALIKDDHTERMRSAGRVGAMVARADGLLRALPQVALPRSRRLADARPGLRRAPDRPDADGRARRVHRGRLLDRAELGAHERRLARPRALRRPERQGRARHRRRPLRGADRRAHQRPLG